MLCVSVGNSAGLKELYSRAQGEVSIREALRELELWGAGATFSLTNYTDSAGREITIIKDWKELINEVRTYVQLPLCLYVSYCRLVTISVCFNR